MPRWAHSTSRTTPSPTTSSARPSSTSTSGVRNPHRIASSTAASTGTDTRFAFCFPPAERLPGPAVPAAGGRQRRPRERQLQARTGHGHRRPGDDLPARRLHGRVEHGPHRRRDGPEGRRRPDDLRLARRGRVRPLLEVRRRAGPRPARRRTPTSTAAAAGRAARRCASPTRPTCGTRRCRSWATPWTATTATSSRVRKALATSPPCSTCSASSGPKIHDVVDAMWPGGSGDPFAGLDGHQREELALLYRLGLPPRRRVHDRPAHGPDLAVVLDGRAAAARRSPTSPTSGPSRATSATTSPTSSPATSSTPSCTVAAGADRQGPDGGCCARQARARVLSRAHRRRHARDRHGLRRSDA